MKTNYNNLQLVINKIKNKIKYYEGKEPHKRMNLNFKKVGKTINNVKDDINLLEDILDNPENYINNDNTDEDINDNDKFKLYLDRIESIKKDISGNQYSEVKLIELYLDMYSMVQWCNEYINRQRMEVIDV
jgi:hypothetical protein